MQSDVHPVVFNIAWEFDADRYFTREGERVCRFAEQALRGRVYGYIQPWHV